MPDGEVGVSKGGENRLATDVIKFGATGSRMRRQGREETNCMAMTERKDRRRKKAKEERRGR